MKLKHLPLVLTVSLLFACSHLTAQQFSNAGFESWQTDTLGQNPESWFFRPAYMSAYFDTLAIKQTTDAYQGAYALHIVSESLIEERKGIRLYNPASGYDQLGIAYEGQPDSLTGYAKFDIQSNDSARIFIASVKNGQIEQPTTVKYFAGNQSQYQRFSIPVNLPSNIDTLYFNVRGTIKWKSGNSLKLDQLAFKGGSGDPIPNGGFENWNVVTAESPDKWVSHNIYTYYENSRLLTKTSDAHSGSYAARLENVHHSLDNNIGIMGYRDLHPDPFSAIPRSGLPLEDQNPAKITGYYKYLPQGQDTAFAVYSLMKHNSATKDTLVTLEEKFTLLPPSDSYTKFELNVDFDSSLMADTLNLAFGSGYNFPSRSGSQLFLDSLTVHYSNGSGIADQPKTEYEVYPVPAEKSITIQSQKLNAQRFKITSLTGQNLKTGQIAGENAQIIDVSELSSGVYLLNLQGERHAATKKIVVK